MPISKLLQPKVLLILICAFFLITRLYKISEIPASVYWDEASIGYNAYSILTTGKDEWGDVLPIHFRAFGEFKLPAYVYAVVPSVFIFGLNEFSVRFPAVIFSLGVVILTYLLSKRLFKDESAALLSSFFVSVSPWFFIFSRTGYEATAGLMFYLLGIYLFLGANKNGWYILFSALSFIMSVYSYNSFRILAPLTVLVLIILNLKTMLSQYINLRFLAPLTVTIVVLLLSIIPIYKLYAFDSGAVRLQAVSASKGEYLGNYLSHFSLDFLFLEGDSNLRSQQGGFGQVSIIEGVLFLLALIYIGRNAKIALLPIILLLLAPLPAALTKESPHALRAISAVPFISLISALSLNIKRKRIFTISIVIITLIFFLNYYFNFLSNFSIKSSKDWQYGYKEIYSNYSKEFNKYDNIIISDNYGQPYIFALFYQRFGPQKYWESVTRNNINEWGFSTVSSFDKFKFGKINRLITVPGNNLIFASPEDQVQGLTPKATVNFLDGTIAFWVFEQRNEN